jgi:hypothetical protein
MMEKPPLRLLPTSVGEAVSFPLRKWEPNRFPYRWTEVAIVNEYES